MKTIKPGEERIYKNKNGDLVRSVMVCCTEVLTQFKDSMNIDQETQLTKMIEATVKEYKEIKEKEGPITAAYSMHAAIDKEIKKSGNEHQGFSVTCKKGCDWCCQIHVDITPDEAELILAHCEEKNIFIGWDRLERQSKFSEKTWLSDQISHETWCGFLNPITGCCIYKHRPGACRNHRSLDDPEKCNVIMTNGKIRKYGVLIAEMLQSAAMTAYGADSMAKMLIKTKKLNDKENQKA